MTEQEKLDLQLIMTKAHDDFEIGLKNHAHFRLNDTVVCEDLVQDAYLKTWNYMITSGKIHLMKPFLYHILNCLIIDEYRKRKTVSLDAMLENGLELGVDDSSKIINHIDGASAIEMIDLLPPTYKTIIHMRYVEELSIDEISTLTGQSKSVIAVKTYRGLDKLKKMYKKNE